MKAGWRGRRPVATRNAPRKQGCRRHLPESQCRWLRLQLARGVPAHRTRAALDRAGTCGDGGSRSCCRCQRTRLRNRGNGGGAGRR
jgi:hypothetical protein